jgi:hypothetical protein
MPKRNLRKYFEDGWNKIFGKEEDKSKDSKPIQSTKRYPKCRNPS